MQALITVLFWFHHFLLESKSCLPLESQPSTPFEAVLTLLLARPKAAAPSVAHGLRPLVVAFLRPRKTLGEGGTPPDFQKYLGVEIIDVNSIFTR